MKNLIITCLICLFTSSIFSQSNCSKFYPFSEGTTTELTIYDKRGRVSAFVNHSVKDVSSAGSTDIATMTQVLKDKGGEEITTTEYEIACMGGLVSIDFKSFAQMDMLESMGDVDYEITGTNLDLPNDLSVGQSLPDAAVNIAMNISGINMDMNTTITDRQVIAEETITTPAGTFECFVMTSTTTFKMGTSKSKQWVSEGVGVVKTEEFTRNGRLRSTSLLTSFSN